MDKKLKIIIIIAIIILVIINIIPFYVYFILDHNMNDIYNIQECKYNNLKVAVVLSGQIRDDFQIPLNVIKNNIINPLKADVFFDFDDNISKKEKETIQNFLLPKKYIWEKYDIENEEYNKYEYILNAYKMTKRIYEANKLKKNYENENNFIYDIVIRVRPDLILKGDLTCDLINNIKDNTLYFPLYTHKLANLFLGKKDRIVDQIDIGTSRTMDIFSDFHLYLEKYKTTHAVTEVMIYKYLLDKKINIDTFYQSYFIYDTRIKLFEINNNLYFIKKYAKRFKEFYLYEKDNSI